MTILNWMVIGLVFSSACGHESKKDETNSHLTALATQTNLIHILPKEDGTLRNVVGSPSNIYVKNVDDAVGAPDNDSTYVRSKAGIGSASHLVKYSGTELSGTITEITVHVRAARGTAKKGSVRVELLNGSTLIGSTVAFPLEAWKDYKQTFSKLTLSLPYNLQTRIILTNSSGSGAVRYTQVYLTASTQSLVVVEDPEPTPAPTPTPVPTPIWVKV